MAVKIVFCLYGDSLTKYAQMMVDTCRMFNYHIVQMSDEVTPMLYGVNEVVRKPMEKGQVTFRYRHLRDIEPPYISLDVDLLVIRDISGMIDPAYDVSMTYRKNHEMIYNGGVFSVHTRGFIEDCLVALENMPDDWQNWTGGQRAMMSIGTSGKYKVKELDVGEWNHSPNVYNMIPCHSRILHFKGARKEFMEKSYDFIREKMVDGKK